MDEPIFKSSKSNSSLITGRYAVHTLVGSILHVHVCTSEAEADRGRQIHSIFQNLVAAGTIDIRFQRPGLSLDHHFV